MMEKLLQMLLQLLLQMYMLLQMYTAGRTEVRTEPQEQSNMPPLLSHRGHKYNFLVCYVNTYHLFTIAECHALVGWPKKEGRMHPMGLANVKSV